MISRQDILLLLTELEDKGIDCKEQVENLYSAEPRTFEVLRFINNKQPLDLINFYEKIRKSYNHKSSKLYKNIMICDEQDLDPNLILTTLSALLNQILQFKVDDKPTFLKHARADEIIKVLDIYMQTYDIRPAYKLLTLVKSDLLVGEIINGRRV